MILANPPYIPKSGRAIEKSVLAEEPHAALFGGKDGLKFIRIMLRDAKSRLSEGGILVFEFDPPQKARIAALARQLCYDISFSRDQYRRWRYATLTPAVKPKSSAVRPSLRKQGHRSKSLAQ
jgi:methylase of polypeptide subunit release factors